MKKGKRSPRENATKTGFQKESDKRPQRHVIYYQDIVGGGGRRCLMMRFGHEVVRNTQKSRHGQVVDLSFCPKKSPKMPFFDKIALKAIIIGRLVREM
jgi:hypothetical protein